MEGSFQSVPTQRDKQKNALKTWPQQTPTVLTQPGRLSWAATVLTLPQLTAFTIIDKMRSLFFGTCGLPLFLLATHDDDAEKSFEAGKVTFPQTWTLRARQAMGHGSTATESKGKSWAKLNETWGCFFPSFKKKYIKLCTKRMFLFYCGCVRTMDITDRKQPPNRRPTGLDLTVKVHSWPQEPWV